MKKNGFNRSHLITMALGNIIGSGIFLASGIVIHLAGPAAVLVYILGGFIMLMEVMFIAEMSIVNPAPGSFRVHISEIFGPGMGFVNGWMFWCSGVLGMASEVTAAAIFSAFWFPKVPLWVFCILYAAVMTLINFLDVRGLSKVEMALASIKVAALAAFVIFGALAVSGVIHIGEVGNSSTGFSNLHGFFPNGIKGPVSSMLIVLFSFTGTGIIGMAVADMNHPEKDLPPSIFIITAAVTILYALSVLFILLLLPWRMVSDAGSPFVTILQNAGIPFAGSVLNLIVLSASLSGLNSSMYSASRMLFSLSRDGQGPKKFLKKSRNGVPIYALGVTSVVLGLTAVLSYVLPQSAFIILTGASSFTAMINWLMISITHLFYRRKTLKERPEKLKYRTPGYPAVTWIAILLILLILFTSPFYPGQIASLVGGVLLVALLAVLYCVLKVGGKLKV